MASRQTPPSAPDADAGNTPPGGEPTPETPAAFTWAELAPAVAMPTKAAFTGISVNVLESVPEPIRQRAEASLVINTERVKRTAGSSAKRPRIDYHWDLQPVPTTDLGGEFVKLLGKYAKYRPAGKDVPHAGSTSPQGQVTARCGDPGYYRAHGDAEYVACDAAAEGAFLAVRYSVRPLEQRATTARLPGTA